MLLLGTGFNSCYNLLLTAGKELKKLKKFLSPAPSPAALKTEPFAPNN